AGFVFSPYFVDGEAFWNGSVAFDEHLIHALHAVPVWVKLSATCVMLIGLATAWYAYIRDTSIPSKTVEQIGPMYRFFYNKWYFDELYSFIFVKPLTWLGRQFWQRVDVGVIDRFGPNGAAWLVEKGAVVAKKVQSGYV